MLYNMNKQKNTMQIYRPRAIIEAILDGIKLDNFRTAASRHGIDYQSLSNYKRLLFNNYEVLLDNGFARKLKSHDDINIMVSELEKIIKDDDVNRT